MYTTRISFLARLSNGDQTTWQDFDSAYKPLLRHWLKNPALSSADVEDLIQEVMLFVASHLTKFQHNTHTGAFRKWLRNSTVNIARNYIRKNQRGGPGLTDFQNFLDQFEDPDSRVSRAFDRDYQRALLHQLLRRSAKDFSPQTMQIFQQYVLEEKEITEVAAAHGVSKAAVYIAKSRVLKRLREEWADPFEAFE